MRTAFIQTLCELAERDERIWLLAGDLGYSVLEPFANQFPMRYVNVGVAEQNMTGVAAGLALCGKIVFTYSIANFPILRCLEQIRNDVCYHDLDVKIVAVGGGVAYGSAGYSHHAVEDLAIMRAMPNMIVVAPGDPIEAASIVRAIVTHPGPCYLRLGKGGEANVHTQATEIPLGRAISLRTGKDLTFISNGAVLAEVIKAADQLAERGLSVGVISMPTIQPLDEEAIVKVKNFSRHIITVEEHIGIGGLGEAVAGVLLASHGNHTRLTRASLSSPFHLTAGSQAHLRQVYELNATGLVNLALRTIGNSRE